MRKHLFLLFISLLFSVFGLSPLEVTAAEKAVPFYDVQCENPADCPGWMAGLAHSKGVCSTFLVTENIMATNLHCIPEDLRIENLSCRERIKVYFPKTSKHVEETAECETIVYTSPPLVENLLTPDFAFFRLKKSVSREVLQLSQDGMGDMNEMIVYKVDPSQSKASGTIRRVQCTAVQNSLLNPFFVSDKSPVVTLMPCHTIHGNSGSPILGSDGKGHGILSAMNPNVSIVADKDIKSGMAKGGVTFGANFSCLNTFFLGGNRGDAADCKVNSDEKTRKQMLEKITAKTMAEAERTLKEKLNGSHLQLVTATKKSVRWKLKQSEPSAEEEKKLIAGVVVLEPECLIRPRGRTEELQNILKKSEILLPLTWAKFKVKLDHDAYYRPKAKIEEELTAATFVFTPLDFLKPKDIAIRVEKARAEEAGEQPLILEKYLVDLCKPKE